MGRIRNTLVTAAIGAALAAQSAPAQTPPVQPTTVSGAPPGAPLDTGITQTGSITGPIQTGGSLTAPSIKPPAPKQPKTHKPAATHHGGTPAKEPGNRPKTSQAPAQTDTTPSTLPVPNSLLNVPSLTPPASGCDTAGAPAALIPIYQAASDQYGLGPQGPGILAAINQIETNFGELNHVTSSAGAVGWMQFMPSTWATWGVDANGDGSADPYDPQDAIFSAARYLRATGMPSDPAGAVFAYNHADWYVAEVLGNAACLGGPADSSGFSLAPALPVLTCKPAPSWKKQVPPSYVDAFERAAGRYDLGRRGVWALAAIARLESNFGKGMSRQQLKTTGPLGLDPTEWARFAVDGNGDGRISHGSIADSSATLARLIWSRGDLRAGIFAHNQAEWYVQAVLSEADAMQGKCQVTTVSWPILLPAATAAPINWSNLTLSNSLEQYDLDTPGRIDPRIIGLIGAITQQHTITLSALRSDHSMLTTSGNVSNHYFGRAMDIAMVDGVPCTDVEPSAPCGTLGRTLAFLPPPSHPTELIYCFDLDGPSGPAFAAADHCDHLHVGFDG